MKPSFIRKKYVVYSLFGEIWKICKTTFFLMLILAVFSIFLGVFSAIKYGSILKFSDIINDNLQLVISNDRGIITFYFITLIFFIIISCLFMFLAKFKIYNIFLVFLFFALGYITGFDIAIIFMCFNIRGAIFLLIMLIPFILILGFILLIGLILLRYYIKTKSSCKCNKILLNFKYFLFILSIIFALILLIQSLLFNFSYIIIIV